MPAVQSLIDEPAATGTIDQYKDHTDPEYVGPGSWNVIHRLAIHSDTNDRQQTFIVTMIEICTGYPCSVCSNHCQEYMKIHPIKEYLGVTIQINGQTKQLGMFIWTWKFHNAVNARLKKPLMSWDTAYNLYSESETLFCSKKCLDADISEEPDPM